MMSARGLASAKEREFYHCVDGGDAYISAPDEGGAIGDNGTSPSDFPAMPTFMLQHPALSAAILLTGSNLFMTFAWYGHLRNMQGSPWWIAAIASWGIALFEYLLQVPANRVGYTALTLGQLKIMQEIITLTVFVPFAMLYMDQPLKLDYLWAALCMAGAAYFIFRS
jgi:uncharacterized protein (DUF486 family)